MCGSHDYDGELGRELMEMHQTGRGITRRDMLLGAGAAIALGGLGVGALTGCTPPGPTVSSSGLPVTRLAMHVHGSWSEGMQSWQQACASAAAIGIDVLYFTDHNFRARALDYMTHLSGAWIPSTTGPIGAHVATLSSAGKMRLMATAAAARPASQLMTIEQDTNASNRLRTGISGQSMTVTFGNVMMDAQSLFEVEIGLSSRPAIAGRPAGQYFLRYRFFGATGSTSKSYSTATGGLVGIVNMPRISSGSKVTIVPETDIAALWPDIHPQDNGFYSLAFLATTGPTKSSIIDVTLAGVTFVRTENDAASVIAKQQSLIAAYAAQYPRVRAFLSEEVSLGPATIPHCNVFGAAPKFDDMATVTPGNFPDYYSSYITAAQALTAANTKGYVTWNHPYGFSAAGSMPDPIATRRALFTSQLTDPIAPFLGALGLEVGYAARGGMPFQSHLDLWDTFTRHGVWLTGTGANDEHNLSDWGGLTNGFFTGVFSSDNSEQAIAASLRRGNAFTAHPGKWPGALLSMDVDNVPMGGVHIGPPATRKAVITAENLPSGCRLQLLASPVDFTGVDPATRLVGEWTAAQLGPRGSGTISAELSQSGPAFYRTQVVLANGVPIATGNPCAFLAAQPPRGVPSERLIAT